ncbi:MAG: PorV/PorQ family protein [Weeksellaceae bacterium]|nr:PorV/PorQ family protein [Weeksellaceae bacterium]MDX9704800.1 PorV/PorQ family protein [Weeksellaceae bacterium]
MKFRFAIITGLIGVLSTAQVTRKYSNEFLSIGVDARAFAMGNAVVANIGDVNAAYWNPAGLTEVYFAPQFSAMHAEYFQSIAKYDYVAAAMPIGKEAAVALSLYRFGVDDILNTTELIDAQGNIDYDRISKFSTADYALSLSYAGFFFGNSDLAVGASAKVVYRHIGKFAKSFGFGIDLGFQYRTPDQFYFGLMARDITTTFNAWSINEKELNTITVTEPGTGNQQTVNEVPEETIELTLPKLQLGVAKNFQINDAFNVLGEFDLNFQFAQTNDLVSTGFLSFSPSLGVEVGYDDMVFLRGGVNNFQNERTFDDKKKLSFQPNIGVGFKYSGISIDYAFTNVGNQSIALYSNIISVKVDLDAFQ